MLHAFLFNAEHPDLASEWAFGPPCTKRVVAALERLDPVPTTRIIRGKILPESLCYDLGGFTLRRDGRDELQDDDLLGEGPVGDLIGYKHVSLYPGSKRVDQVQYSPDMDRFKTVVCDLAETLSAPPSTVNEQELLMHLSRGLVWAVTTSSLTDEQALDIDRELREFPPYLGMSKVDLGNPTHRHLMIEDMFNDDLLLCPDGLMKRVDSGLPEEDLEEAMCIAQELCPSGEPQLVEDHLFAPLLPPLPGAQSSARGELSRARVAGKMAKGHKERVGRALLEHFEGLEDGETVSFSTATDEGVSEFDFPPEKFTQYLLNLEHPEGKGKAKILVEGLGIQPTDWQFLATQIEQAMATAPIYRAGKNAQGFTHGAYVLVTGRNGRSLVLETGWILEAEKPARFVTAYPGEEALADRLEAPEPLVVDPELVGSDRCAAIIARADAEGLKAATEAQPTPMVIEDHGTIWEGECGRAWVAITDRKDPVTKWLLTTGRASLRAGCVEVRSPVATQSVERHRAFAEGFAKVLRANGTECTTGFRLD